MFGSQLLPDDQLGIANQHLHYRKQRAIKHKGTLEAALGASTTPPITGTASNGHKGVTDAAPQTIPGTGDV